MDHFPRSSNIIPPAFDACIGQYNGEGSVPEGSDDLQFELDCGIAQLYDISEFQPGTKMELQICDTLDNGRTVLNKVIQTGVRAMHVRWGCRWIVVVDISSVPIQEGEQCAP